MLRLVAAIDRGDAAPPATDDTWATLRELAMLRGVSDAALRSLVDANLVAAIAVPRDTVLEVPPALRDPVCMVVSGQISIGLFERAALAARGRPQRDAALGEQDGTLMPPRPLAHAASKNLALFRAGELFNLRALAPDPGDAIVAAFSITPAVVVLIGREAMTRLAHGSPAVHDALARALGRAEARLRAVIGVKHEILDFYVRNGLSIAGPAVRLRQLDLCIDCKQCEDACEERHGARRLTLGGFELGVIDVVYTCRTCTDARCLSPCEHDAIKRDPKSGEIKIIEDRCIGCSLCALSCPYGAIDMVNVAEPAMPSYSPRLKARLDRGDKLAFGAGKGRRAPARRIANKCDHCDGYAEQACVSACPTGALIELAPDTLFRERAEPTGKRKRKRLDVLPTEPFTRGINVRDSGEARVRARRLSLLVWTLGLVAFLAILAEVALRWYAPTLSASYHLLRYEGLEPAIAELNVSYLAGSRLALTCGYVGTALMVLSMAYPLQRRFGWFHRTATNQFWLDVHLMTGLVGPMFILLHSALRLTTWVSIPFWSMVAVVVSGVLGRYLYTLVPALTSKHDLEVLEHRRAITELASAHPAACTYANEVMNREAARSEQAWAVGLTALLLWIIVDDVRRWWASGSYRRGLRRLARGRVAGQIARRIDRVVLFERRRELAPRSQALLRAWKRIHIPFALVLLVTMAIHIAVALGLAG